MISFYRTHGAKSECFGLKCHGITLILVLYNVCLCWMTIMTSAENCMRYELKLCL